MLGGAEEMTPRTSPLTSDFLSGWGIDGTNETRGGLLRAAGGGGGAQHGAARELYLLQRKKGIPLITPIALITLIREFDLLQRMKGIPRDDATSAHVQDCSCLPFACPLLALACPCLPLLALACPCLHIITLDCR